MGEPRFEIIDQKTRKVVHTIPLTSTHPRDVERAFDGLVRKVDFDKFWVREMDIPKGS